MSKELKQQESLNWLLEAVEPRKLSVSIQSILFSYLLEQEQSGIDADFKRNIENCKLLMRFLNELEESAP